MARGMYVRDYDGYMKELSGIIIITLIFLLPYL